MILHQRLLRSIYGIPSLINPTILTRIIFCGVLKILFPIDDYCLFSHSKNIIHCSYRALLSHRTSCTPAESILHLANFLATTVVLVEPDLYGLLTFQLPHLVPPFHCLGRTKASVQFRGTGLCFMSMPVVMVRSFQHPAQPLSSRITSCRLSATAYSIYS